MYAYTRNIEFKINFLYYELSQILWELTIIYVPFAAKFSRTTDHTTIVSGVTESFVINANPSFLTFPEIVMANVVKVFHL
jgi:hypothetical protein